MKRSSSLSHTENYNKFPILIEKITLDTSLCIRCTVALLNLLTPEFYIYILAHPVFKM